MDRDLTPAPRELELVFGLEVLLAADADHEVLEERVVDERERRVVDGLCEVDTGDDRAERPCFAGDGDVGTDRARHGAPFGCHIRYRT